MMATMINLQISSDVPFTSDDFLGRGDREKRLRDKQTADLKVRQLNARLTTMLPRVPKGGSEPAELPLWARKNPHAGEVANV